MYGGKLFQAAVIASSLLACAAHARAQDALTAHLFDATRQRTERDAQAAQKDWAWYLKRQVVEKNSLGMELVRRRGALQQAERSRGVAGALLAQRLET